MKYCGFISFVPCSRLECLTPILMLEFLKRKKATPKKMCASVALVFQCGRNNEILYVQMSDLWINADKCSKNTAQLSGRRAAGMKKIIITDRYRFQYLTFIDFFIEHCSAHREKKRNEILNSPIQHLVTFTHASFVHIKMNNSCIISQFAPSIS